MQPCDPNGAPPTRDIPAPYKHRTLSVEEQFILSGEEGISISPLVSYTIYGTAALTLPLQNYLVSWHHLTAYFSRLDVSRAYIDALERSDPLSDRISVRRSHKIDLRNPDARVTLASIFLGSFVANLERFDRPEIRHIAQQIRES